MDDLPVDDFECPVCAAGEFSPLLVLDAHGREREASGLYRCRTCGFCFADATQYRRGQPKSPRTR